MKKSDFVKQLINAGWEPHEADEEWARVNQDAIESFCHEGTAAWSGVNVRELRGELTWKPEKPTRAGWYWFLLGDSPVIVNVKHGREIGARGGIRWYPDGLYAHFLIRGWQPLDEIEESKWAGPIQPPE